MYKMHESKNSFEKLQMATAVNPFRGGPGEKTGDGVTIPPPQNSCKGNLSERKILQAVQPKKIQAEEDEEVTCLV